MPLKSLLRSRARQESFPTLTAVRAGLAHRRLPDATDERAHEVLLGEVCRIPRSYLDCWERVYADYAQVVRATQVDPRGQRLHALAGYLGALCLRPDLASRLTTVDGTGWCIVLFVGAEDRPNQSVMDLVDQWPAEVRHAWLYAAAGISPAEAVAAPAPDAANLAILAALRGFPVPAEV